MLKLEITKKDGECELNKTEPKVKKKTFVRWYAKGSDAFVHFAKNQWPFEGDWPGCITIEKGKKSDKFETKKIGTWFYDYGCSKCKKKRKRKKIFAAARIIIN